jgi:serine/threonine protein kinase
MLINKIKVLFTKLHFNNYFFFFVFLETNNYMLIMEYADGGNLRNFLKNNFSKLTWNDKFNMAYQLACAVLCLHSEEIVHRDLVFYFTII